MSMDVDRQETDEGRRRRQPFERLSPERGPRRAEEQAVRRLAPACADDSPSREKNVARTAKDEAPEGAPTRPASSTGLRRLAYYGLALLFVAVAAGLRWAMPGVLSSSPFLVFYLAWVGAAAFGGLGPGLLATVASWLCIDLLFDYTIGRIDFATWTSVDRLLVFLVGGLVVSVVGEKMRRSRIGERRQAQELATANAALVESRKRYRRLVEETSDWVWEIDADGVYTYSSPRVLELLRHAPEEIVGKTPFDFMPPGEAQRVGSAFRSICRERKPLELFENILVRKDGSLVTVETSGRPVFAEDGSFLGYAGVDRDVTARKRTEEALRELNATLESKVAQRTAELQHRAAQLQRLVWEVTEAEERERQRLAGILHDDLQQVLAGAKFHLSILDGGARSAEKTRAVVLQVKGLLQEAIEKSRTLSHELSPVVLHQGDLAEMIEWLARQMHSRHGLTVHVVIRGHVESPPQTLKVLLYRAIQELLFNVVKHAQVREAGVHVRGRGRYLCLSVSDRGSGFDPRQLATAAGSGLLRLRERIELLGGRMKIRSAEGQGSTFRMVLPYDDAVATFAAGQ
jgi:PAS domain S-box-containing protein